MIVLTSGDGALDLSKFETNEKSWGWLLPEDVQRLRFAPNARCDVMLVDGRELDMAQDVLADAQPHVLLWKR